MNECSHARSAAPSGAPVAVNATSPLRPTAASKGPIARASPSRPNTSAAMRAWATFSALIKSSNRANAPVSRHTLKTCSAVVTTDAWVSSSAARTAARDSAVSIRASVHTALRRASAAGARRKNSATAGTAAEPRWPSVCTARCCTSGRPSASRAARSTAPIVAHGNVSPRASAIFGAPVFRTR